MSDRRRVRAANALLARVNNQRQRFATAYGTATSPQARFAATADALRAAAAERHHRRSTDTGMRLDQLTSHAVALLDELHREAERHAHRTLRAEQRRIARNTGRNRDEHPRHTAA